MFKNVGNKIKAVAEVFFVLSCAADAIIAIVYWIKAFDASARNNTDTTIIYIVVGILLFIAGPFFAWISSLFIYGFGIIVNSKEQQDENSNSPDIVCSNADIQNERTVDELIDAINRRNK